MDPSNWVPDLSQGANHPPPCLGSTSFSLYSQLASPFFAGKMPSSVLNLAHVLCIYPNPHIFQGQITSLKQTFPDLVHVNPHSLLGKGGFPSILLGGTCSQQNKPLVLLTGVLSLQLWRAACLQLPWKVLASLSLGHPQPSKVDFPDTLWPVP